jgi:aminoglycoside phosphotransferase (APT) family kinase protein
MRAPVPPAEVAVDARLARRLLRDQHPDLAGLPLRRVGTGWDNVIFRLGAELTVRIPRRALGAGLVDTELRWLPLLEEVLPLPVPTPVRAGRPTEHYPWSWSVCRYVPGRPIAADVPVGRAGIRAATDLAGFLAALHVPAPAGAPRNPVRGVALADRSEALRRALPAVGAADRARVAAAWRRALEASGPSTPATWVHGDLHGLNVLAAGRRISGVIDFGDLCAGDRATDLACAWLLLDAPGRRHLRAALAATDDQWERGRGWALYLSVMFLAHSAGAPGNERIGRRGLAEVLSDPAT